MPGSIQAEYRGLYKGLGATNVIDPKIPDWLRFAIAISLNGSEDPNERGLVATNKVKRVRDWEKGWRSLGWFWSLVYKQIA